MVIFSSSYSLLAKMVPKTLKRSRSPSPSIIIASTSTLSQKTPIESPHKAKKLKTLSSYATESPFPNFLHPTPTEAQKVFDILSAEFPKHRAAIRTTPLASSNSAKTCGNVPNVIEALIGTILSQNTSGRNSSSAKASLDQVFGRNNFEAIASAPKSDVVEAIRHGGLANKKSETIQKLLREVKSRRGEYSLQYLAEEDGETTSRMPDQDIMKELISYDGVGPKTASCVLLFCLGRESFAVDTHVFRLSKFLGWVPEKADRVLAQAHLDLRVPGELKYGLHVLMIQHGRTCKGCRGQGAKTSCVLKGYLKDRKEEGS